MAQRLLLVGGIAATIFGSLAPFAWFVLTSFKTQPEVEAVPPSWWPSGGWHFYRAALFDHHLLAYVGNSVIVAGSTTVVALAIGIPAAYVLARIKLPGKSWILGGLLTVSMFPQMAIAGPVWRLLSDVRGLNTHWGLVLPYVTFSLPIVIWILASFFKELPVELEEAARVDGCNTWQTLIRIMLPLAAPGIFTAAILTFIYAWNEFFFALLILTQPDKQTLPLGIALFQGEFTIPWGELAAASVLATLPLVFMVLLFQRWIISGLSAGAVKG
jgi:multiple sugar transport system permease protein